MRIDERERQRAARRQMPAQLPDQFVHFVASRVRKNGISENRVELDSRIRNRQADNTLRVE